MTITVDTALTVVLIIAASVWIGGVVTVIIVGRISKQTLDDATRVKFFHAFGRAYLAVAGPALVVTGLIGWSFLARQEWSGELGRMAFASTLLVAVLIAGIMQARSMTRMRAKLTQRPGDIDLARKIKTQATTATVLRTLIVVLTFGLTVHASAQLTSLL